MDVYTDFDDCVRKTAAHRPRHPAVMSYLFSAHMLQRRPRMFVRQGHCPLSESHCRSVDPATSH